jgi:hypothetical protein
MHSPEPSQLAMIEDHVLAHHFIRCFGRCPTVEELARYREALLAQSEQRPRRHRALARLVSRH